MESTARRFAKLTFTSPALAARAAVGKARKYLPLPPSPHEGSIGAVRFSFDFSAAPTVSMMYRSTYQPEVVAVMRRVLREGDVFVDVGANIGYFSAVGAAMVGPTGQVHAFEPVPKYHEALAQNAALNPGHSIRVNGLAVSDTPGTIDIFVNEEDNIGANSVLKQMVPAASAPVRVETVRLDSYLERLAVRDVRLIKIDVEGWELAVLRSLEGYLASVASVPAILCEFTPSSYGAAGHTIDDVAKWIQDNGCRVVDPLTRRPVTMGNLEHQRDLLLLPQGSS